MRPTLLLLFLALFVVQAFPQDDKKALGEVTVYAEDPVYKSLRSLSSAADIFAGEYATVTNLILRKDAATFALENRRDLFHEIG